MNRPESKSALRAGRVLVQAKKALYAATSLAFLVLAVLGPAITVGLPLLGRVAWRSPYEYFVVFIFTSTSLLIVYLAYFEVKKLGTAQ